MAQLSEDESTDTFTGEPLAALTLTQRLLELRIDAFENIALRQGFSDNLAVFGLVGAMRHSLRRWRLGPTGVAMRLDSLEAQLAANRELIRADPAAKRPEGYRGGRYLAEVTEVLDAFDEGRTTLSPATLRQYLVAQQRDLAQELRSLGLPARPAGPPARRGGATLLRTAEHVLLPVLLLALPFVVGFVAYRSMRRALRPESQLLTELEAPLRDGAATSRAPHAGVRAAAELRDLAASVNQLTNDVLDARRSTPELVARVDEVLTTSGAVEDHVRAAHAAMELATKAVSALDGSLGALGSSWTETSDENGHYEERCTTTTDSKGNKSESCSSRWVCDSVDYEWTFDAGRAEQALAQLDAARLGLRSEQLEAFRLPPLRWSLTMYAPGEERSLSSVEKAQADVLESEPVKALRWGDDRLTPLLDPDAPRTDLKRIQGSYRGFAPRSAVNVRCSVSPSRPEGYRITLDFTARTREAIARVRQLDESYRKAPARFAALRRGLDALRSETASGWAWQVTDAALGAHAASNELHLAFFPSGALAFPTSTDSAWNALWFGLGGAAVSALAWWLVWSRRRAEMWRQIAHARGG